MKITVDIPCNFETWVNELWSEKDVVKGAERVINEWIEEEEEAYRWGQSPECEGFSGGCYRMVMVPVEFYKEVLESRHRSGQVPDKECRDAEEAGFVKTIMDCFDQAWRI